MDEKVKEIIEPFADWDIGGLKFRRVMSAIDAIVESKIEKLKNELNAKIQKLQIEKTFPPEITNENESKVWGELCHPEDISDQYRNSKVPILLKENVTKGKTEKSKKEPVHLWYSAAEVIEDKRTKTRNKLKELFGGVIMTITNEREVNENFTYSNSDLQTLKKNIRKYIRNLICTIPESEPLYIYSNKNKQIEKPITCYHTRNYQILPDILNKNSFIINIGCLNCVIKILITLFSKSAYFLSVRNKDPENKSYNFAIVNTKTKEFVIFTKDKFVFDDWKLEITAER